VIPLTATIQADVIWLLRHGDAEDPDGDDAARELTVEGRRQARAAGLALARLGVELDRCLSSPKARAEQTARIACAELGVEVELTEALRGGDFDPVPLVSGLGRVLLVGHEPDFSRAVARATGARVELEKGGLAAIEDSRLIALLRPGALREIAAP
jgi:phosphohistidine phosphatase